MFTFKTVFFPRTFLRQIVHALHSVKATILIAKNLSQNGTYYNFSTKGKRFTGVIRFSGFVIKVQKRQFLSLSNDAEKNCGLNEHYLINCDILANNIAIRLAA